MLSDTRINPTIRKIPQSEFSFVTGEQAIIGEGRFGVCHKARYCHFEVVVKKLKKGNNARLLIHEANMMITCTTKYTPYLFGINLPQSYLIMSSHGSSGTLAAVLERYADDHKAASWVQLVIHVAEGIRAIHSKDIVHNDLKTDNVLLDATDGSYFPIIADLGKACVIKDGQKLTVRAEKQEMYMKKYAHLRHGLMLYLSWMVLCSLTSSLPLMLLCLLTVYHLLVMQSLWSIFNHHLLMLRCLLIFHHLLSDGNESLS